MRFEVEKDLLLRVWNKDKEEHNRTHPLYGWSPVVSLQVLTTRVSDTPRSAHRCG